MIWAAFMQSKMVRYAGVALAFVLAIVTFGASKKRQGKEQAYDEMQEQDRAEADGIRKRVRDVERLRPDDLRYRD